MCFLQNNSFGQVLIKGTKEIEDIKIDKKGDAYYSHSEKFNASEWDDFKRTWGSNPALLKRYFEKMMPTNSLTDFKYDEFPMERKYTMHMKIAGKSELGENGKWTVFLNTEDPDIIEVSGHHFRFNENYAKDEGLVELIQNIYLPDNAKNARIEKDLFGESILVYKAGGSFMNLLFTIGGILLIIAGIGLYFFNRLEPVKMRKLEPVKMKKLEPKKLKK